MVWSQTCNKNREPTRTPMFCGELNSSGGWAEKVGKFQQQQQDCDLADESSAVIRYSALGIVGCGSAAATYKFSVQWREEWFNVSQSVAIVGRSLSVQPSDCRCFILNRSLILVSDVDSELSQMLRCRSKSLVESDRKWSWKGRRNVNANPGSGN